MTPEELLRHAKSLELSGISITDHDTIEAYGVAVGIAKDLGLLLGNGVEFSSSFRHSSVHILGYDFDLNSPEILNLCARHQKRRRDRNQIMLDKLARLGLTISGEELAAIGGRSVGRPHIAWLMVKKGYVTSVSQAFQMYLGDGRSCYDPGEPISSEETIAIIHQGGGKAFLAHPHLLEHAGKVKDLLKLPFDGIECHYARFTPEKERRWIRIAREKGWLMSGGSDFHGAVKEYIPLGCSWVDEDTFFRIFQRLDRGR